MKKYENRRRGKEELAPAPVRMLMEGLVLKLSYLPLCFRTASMTVNTVAAISHIQNA